jgi:hypothetical protein
VLVVITSCIYRGEKPSVINRLLTALIANSLYVCYIIYIIFAYIKIHETMSFLCLNIYKNLEMMLYVVGYYHIIIKITSFCFLFFKFNCLKKN